MAPSPVMQVLRALDSAVDAALNDHTISTEELGHTTSFLTMTVSRMNQYRNQFKTHVGKLPPETLARIFEFVVAPDKAIYTSSPARPCAADHLALVCKSWRTTALGWPRLWYHISDEAIHPYMSMRKYLP
ncbi:hypothetical protein OH76DRAFT_1402817 [Lentinus brumalis]|uniref:Uncharacterized protein n=1 Tax=Lentinus brumalis TaxID=2498619 RepID=A0A371DCV8_9APHY|nr:hypothetical protein OH76DRAFT_1402817 [Polyporus brumalis]